MCLHSTVLGQLAETYVKSIRSGEVPCLDNAVKALAQIENAKAVEQAHALYLLGMEPILFPTSQEELSTFHAFSESEALAHFMKLSFRDDNREHRKKLEVWIHSLSSNLVIPSAPPGIYLLLVPNH